MALLRASSRPELGSRKVRHLRDKGLIPGIIYGHRRDAVPVTLSEHDVELALQHGERVLEVDLDGQKETVLVKDVQWDTFGQMVHHVDLCRVRMDERVEVTVPVVLRGTPAGAADGGVLHQAVTDVTIECPVVAIPEEFRVSVTKVAVGQTLCLRDIPLPDGVRLLGDADAVLCTCSVVAEEVPVEEAVEPEAAEPEVIGRKEEGEEKAEEGS